MSDLSPDTIPLPARGWTRERKAQFLDYLSEKGNVRAACARVGLSREAAYRQRRRDADFARGWAAALVLAHDAGVDVLANRAIDGIEEGIWYRGELVGTRRKYDTRLLLAHIARLDKLVEEQPAAAKDAARFDELLACIGGEIVPADLRDEDDDLPLDREEAMREAAARAEDAVRYARPKDDESDEAPIIDPEADEDACIEAFRRGRIEGAARWDLWFDDACGYVDWLSGWEDGVAVEPMSSDLGDDWDEDDWEDGEAGEPGELSSDPRTVSDVSSAGQPVPGPAADESDGLNSDGRTVSDVSTGCDAAPLAGRDAGSEPTPPPPPET